MSSVPSQRLSRRRFLELGGSSLLLPLAGCASNVLGKAPGSELRMGMIADLHHGLEPTAMSRLDTFLRAAEERRADCIAQLGDFNYAKPESRECIELWEQFKGPGYHALGNHDMDFTTKEQTIEAWSMPARYYSFDRGGYHFVVLDRNNLKTPDGYVAYSRGNYFVDPRMRGYADPQQIEWLRGDLKASRLPTVALMHQGLGMQNEPLPSGDPRGEIEAVFEEANRDARSARVVACFCGHHHRDRHNFKNGIHYVWINSASYFWVGPKYGRMAPYKDALFAIVTFRSDGWILVEGRRSEWVKPTPSERGYPRAAEATPVISDRRLDTSITATSGRP